VGSNPARVTGVYLFNFIFFSGISYRLSRLQPVQQSETATSPLHVFKNIGMVGPVERTGLEAENTAFFVLN